MDDIDPIAQFFPDNPSISLYDVLGLGNTASANEIKGAYRKLALIHHPDKHASVSEEAQRAAATHFQQVGFAYAVLGDEKRRKKYDETGSASEVADWEGKDAEGWELYFEQMFDKVTRGKLDEMKKEYQGSEEEAADLKEAYQETQGSIEGIIAHIPHSNYTDESRFIEIINGLIERGELKSLPAWKKGLKDTKGRAARKRKGEEEAEEAESMAKELGVWDEFFGSGKEGKRRGKGKGKGKGQKDQAAEDVDGEAALKAIIQSRQKKLGGFFESLEAKYSGDGEKKSQGKKRAAEPDIDEEEFARIQKSLKSKPNSLASQSRATRTKGKRAK